MMLSYPYNQNYRFNGKPNAQRGFTLLELMIAITILTGMVAIYVVQLNQVNSSIERLDKRSKNLQDIQLFFNLLTSDFEHIAARPVMGEDKKLLPALLSVENRVELTRSGVPNPLLIMHRSSMARVTYELKENILYRDIKYQLDKDEDAFVDFDEEALGKPALEGVKSIFFEFLVQDVKTAEYEWFEEWPEGASDADFKASFNQPMPLSVKVTIEHEDLGLIYRYFRSSENRFGWTIRPDLD